ncbi:MAG: hypothetical protein JXJ20_15195 [Anaerolineae bacterium]|jgi:RNA recognition motif-containing protein|nr:hypothetical protein [Anaerolineae bacterium]
MREALFVSNLPPDTPEDWLHDLFGQYGAVVSLTIDTEERTEQTYALVEMESEKAATKANRSLNGYTLGDYRLAISYPEPDFSRELTNRQRKTVQAIIDELEETDEVPLRQIEAIVLLCGGSFAEAILEEAQAIHAAGTMMTNDGTRQRTKGGIFFYLARYRMAQPVRRIVYSRKGKLPE